MARTILQIAQEAAERHATAPPPPTLFGTNDRTARILRTAASDITRDILRRSKFQGLSEFRSQWVFTTVPNIYAYKLPPDFLRMIPNTEHRGSWPLSLVGPLSPETWSWMLVGMAGTSVEMGWTIRNNTLFVEPTPKAYEVLVIEYISRFPVVRDVVIAEDVDTNVTPALMRAPLVPRDGFVARQVKDVRESDVLRFETEGWGDQWAEHFHDLYKRVDLEWTDENLPWPQVRQEFFANDTDLPAFEDDHLLSLGMTMKLRQSMGLPYGEEASDYENELESKIVHDAGGPRDFRPGGHNEIPEAYPLGGGNWLVS